MNVYSLSNRDSGAHLGLFNAETAEEAYDAMLLDAEYASREQFARIDIDIDNRHGETEDEFVARKVAANREEILINELGGSFDLDDDRLSDEDVDFEVSPHAIVVRFEVDGDTQEFREEAEDMQPHLERLAKDERAYVASCVDAWFRHVRPDDLRAAVAHAPDLDTLLEALEARDAFHKLHGDARSRFDDTDLPTFGTEPASTDEIWSWDDTRFLRHDNGWKLQDRAGA